MIKKMWSNWKLDCLTQLSHVDEMSLRNMSQSGVWCPPRVVEVSCWLAIFWKEAEILRRQGMTSIFVLFVMWGRGGRLIIYFYTASSILFFGIAPFLDVVCLSLLFGRHVSGPGDGSIFWLQCTFTEDDSLFNVVGCFEREKWWNIQR